MCEGIISWTKSSVRCGCQKVVVAVVIIISPKAPCCATIVQQRTAADLFWSPRVDFGPSPCSCHNSLPPRTVNPPSACRWWRCSTGLCTPAWVTLGHKLQKIASIPLLNPAAIYHPFYSFITTIYVVCVSMHLLKLLIVHHETMTLSICQIHYFSLFSSSTLLLVLPHFIEPNLHYVLIRNARAVLDLCFIGKNVSCNQQITS